MLNDTDFDGMQDNIDSNKIDGTFKGSANNIGQVEYVSDFRYFFVDNNQYNDELSTMSLMLSNLANGGTAPMHGRQMSIGVYLDSENFSTPLHKTTFKISDSENINGDLYLAKKTIQVGANKKAIKRYKDVYGVFLGGFNNKNAYRKLLANISDEAIDRYYKNVANDIMSYIKNNKPMSDNDNCYWITGYGISGSIANIVAKELLDEGKEVYCYTFGITPNNVEGVGSYSAIKNIINEDMLEHKLLKSDNKFSMYGTKYNGSIKNDYIREYINKFGKDYQGNYKLTNFISKEYESIRNVLEDTWFYDKVAGYLYNGSRMWQEGTANTQYFGSLLDSNKKAISDGKSLKSYYILSKNLNGFRTSDNNQEYDEIYMTPDSNETKVTAKDLVVGDGTKERPYYSDTQSLSFDTIEDEFWCKFSLNGATDAEYSIHDGYTGTIYTKMDGINYIDRRTWNNSGTDLFYKRTELNDGINEYYLELVKNSVDVESGREHISISFNQHCDVKENVENAKWTYNDDSVVNTDVEFYDEIRFISKELAPTIIAIEINDNTILNNACEKAINGLMDVVSIIEILYTYKGIVQGTMLCNANECLQYMIDQKCENSIWEIIKNPYSAEQYKNDLLNYSHYHIPTVIIDNIKNVIGVCDNGIIIKEKDATWGEALLPIKLKECEEWSDETALGLIGVFGGWDNE